MLSVSLSPDGKRILTSSGRLVAFHNDRGEVTRTIHSHVEEPAYLGFTSAGVLVTATTEHPRVRVWGLDDASAPVRTATPPATMNAVEVAFDASHETSAWLQHDGEVKVWSVRAGAPPIRTFSRSGKHTVDAVALSADGAWLATAGEEVRVVGVADGKDRFAPIATQSSRRPGFSCGGGVCALAFSPEGGHLARLDEDGLTLMELADPTHPWSIDIATPNGQLGKEHAHAFSFGRGLVGTMAGYIRVYWRSMDLGATESVVELGQTPRRVAISPDGLRIAAVMDDGIIDLIGTREARVVRKLTLPSGRSLYLVAFSPDGRLVAATSVDGVHVWSVADGELRATLRGVRDSDAAYVLSGDGQIEILGAAGEIPA
jgi:WD40 repeat protein